MNIRRLNDSGIEEFAKFLDSQTTDYPEPYPGKLLTDPERTQKLPNSIPIDRIPFERRFEMAEYLYKLIPETGIRDPERDAGLWTWIALYWYEQLCPIDKNGKRLTRERARLVANVTSSYRSYRHLVLGPFLIFAAHEDDPHRAMCLLYTPPNAPGELVGQIASTQLLAQNRAIVGAATKLYLDRNNNLRKLAADKLAGGSARRLRAIVGQFDLTYDLFSLDEKRFLNLLPKEFNRFKQIQN